MQLPAVSNVQTISYLDSNAELYCVDSLLQIVFNLNRKIPQNLKNAD